MTYTELVTTIEETERFLKKAKALRNLDDAKESNRPSWHCILSFPTQQGEVRRASMDLTRQLSRLRRP